MSQVFLIQAFKEPEQLRRLVSRLTYCDTKFIIHVDLNVEINDFKSLFSTEEKNVIFLSNRKAGNWGTFNQVEAIISGLHYICKNIPTAKRVTLLNCQDYPIKPAKDIYNFLNTCAEKIFIEYFKLPVKHWDNGGINRFPQFEEISQQITLFGGAQWWSIPMKTIRLMLSDIEDNIDFISYYKQVYIPDESFFQTYILNSDDENIKKNIVNNNLRQVILSETSKHPRTILIKDLQKLSNSKKLFAGNFDIEVDFKILDQIDKQLLSTSALHEYQNETKITKKNISQAILMLSNTASTYYNQFARLRSELPNYAKAFLLYHRDLSNQNTPQLDFEDVFVFDNSILTSLGLEPIGSSLLPGSNHFPLFSFFHSNPDFDYYWVIEDDVFYNGEWKELFASFNPDAISADLITSHIRFFSDEPTWLWWHTLQSNNKANINNMKEQLASFNPIYRISKRALVYLELKMQQGWKGHHETLMPTLLFDAGFTLLDFGGSGRFSNEINNYYKVSICSLNDFEHYTTLRYRPLISIEEITDKLIYHPVKFCPHRLK